MTMQTSGRRADLEAARVRLWEAIDGTRQVETGTNKETGEVYTSTEALAPLIRELRAVVAELAALPMTQEGTKADELRARREARRSNADDSASAPRRAQSRRSNGSHRAG